MKRSQIFPLSIFGCRAGTVLLAWAFGFGLLAGSLASIGAQQIFAEVRQTLARSAGISALVPTVLPLLVSGFVVYSRWLLLLIPTAFWKAFSFSYAALGVILAWGSAGWLLCGLTMFGSFSALPVLWWYWLRHIGGEGFSGRTFLPALGAMIVISWADTAVISPFLTNILIF